jgi:hypothetical protein
LGTQFLSSIGYSIDNGARIPVLILKKPLSLPLKIAVLCDL